MSCRIGLRQPARESLPPGSGSGTLQGMAPRSDLIPITPGIPATPATPAIPAAPAIPATSLARPLLPRSTALSTSRLRGVDLDEQMDPLAVTESTADVTQSYAATLSQLVVIGIASAAIWWLLPRGVTARPPLELPEPLQAETAPLSPAPLSSAKLTAENTAIGLLKQALPTQALAAFQQLVDSPDGASVNLWRYYLQTLVDLDERAELRQRAKEFLSRHPDRLEAAHFLAEAIRRDTPERNRSRGEGWKEVWGWVGARQVSPETLAEIDRCQGTIDDALGLLQQHDGDWSMAGRIAWADLLHLDRARLHASAWQHGGQAFADPRRELALDALRQMSSTTTADALTLRLAIFRECRDSWPSRLPFGSKKQLVNGFDWTQDDLQRAIDADRAAVDRLPPLGRR